MSQQKQELCLRALPQLGVNSHTSVSVQGIYWGGPRLFILVGVQSVLSKKSPDLSFAALV